MRLFLDEKDGTGMIACPECGLPLLLAAERKGRWVVGYEGLHLRVGKGAMLVCPDLNCSHREHVTIAGAREDAVVYSSQSAAHLWRVSASRSFETLGEIRERLARIEDLYRRTGNPKAPSAFRFWREEYRHVYAWVVPALKHGLKSKDEVFLQGKETSQYGRVIELFPDSVLLDRSENNETVLVPLGDLQSVSHHMPRLLLDPGLRFDFRGGVEVWKNTHCVNTTTQFAMVSGHRVALCSVTRDGKCLIETADSEAARALGLRLRVRDHYQALVPAGMIDRCFKSVRWCYVRGHRLELHSDTNRPDVFQLRTRSMDTARLLKMRREWTMFVMTGRRERNQLRWWGYFHQREIERTEEKQIPLEISDLIRAVQIWQRKEEARAATEQREWAAMEAEDEDSEEEEDESDDASDDEDEE